MGGEGENRLLVLKSDGKKLKKREMDFKVKKTPVPHAYAIFLAPLPTISQPSSHRNGLSAVSRQADVIETQKKEKGHDRYK